MRMREKNQLNCSGENRRVSSKRNNEYNHCGRRCRREYTGGYYLFILYVKKTTNVHRWMWQASVNATELYILSGLTFKKAFAFDNRMHRRVYAITPRVTEHFQIVWLQLFRDSSKINTKRREWYLSSAYLFQLRWFCSWSPHFFFSYKAQTLTERRQWNSSLRPIIRDVCISQNKTTKCRWVHQRRGKYY